MTLNWTPEQDELVAELWSAGTSAGEIAKRIDGRTRNAVIGRIHRLRGPAPTKRPASARPRGNVEFASRPTQVRQARSAVPRPVQAARRPMALRVLEPVVPPVVILKLNEREPDGVPVSIVELCSAACKWPVTETGPHMFCNKIRRGDGPYCDEHAAKSYEPLRSRRPSDQVHRTAIDKSSTPAI